MLDHLNKLTYQVEELEQYSKYLTVLSKIEDISHQLQAALITQTSQPALSNFTDLILLYKSIQTSKCSRLLKFVEDTVIFWNNIIKSRIAREFEEVLKSMRWPVVTSTIQTPTPPNIGDIKKRMEIMFKQMLHLQLPYPFQNHNYQYLVFEKIVELPPLAYPMQLMLLPLRKRFRFHFYGNKQTNSLDKPEWYFTQVLTWIRDHEEFLDKNIQPLIKEQDSQLNVKVEFMRGLVQLVMEKILHDVPELLYDDHQISHMIDEALMFDKELRLTYSYPYDEPGCLHVLVNGDVFKKWLVIEKKFAVEKIDGMLSSPTAWLSQYKDIVDIEELKVPECAESFMTLLLTITDRYKPLPTPTSQLKFLKLQLELLEEFRVRVVQIMKGYTHSPVGEEFTAILNGVHYVIEVLREWSELVVKLMFQINYLHLGSFIENLNLSKLDYHIFLQFFLLFETTVFEDVIEKYESLKNEMIKNCVNYIAMDIQAHSQPYRKDRWLALPSQKELQTTLGLSASACDMFLVLKQHLAIMDQLLSKPLFNKLWQRLTGKLNKFFMDEVILSNHFNDGGATQLQFDMTRNLFPLFGEFTQKPENYFREVKEACILLTLKPGSAILLKEVLQNEGKAKDPNSKHTDIKQTLGEMGVHRLPPMTAGRILSLRADLNIS
ncbi:hypothetical protein LOTGIDRAFT_212244 [Lottia gigantea]|uniref:RAD50-interacting protein 1 n=1 Tax=Lottia gigantea TaxID=225164 RepID=V4AIU2_LOTGI|nr:hypothetical protein LOTGIDRAFT_212244 [Lottia gigantea]ESP04039.1 hypothetical protein LOTGIDRAFT_212244 [Lottia gigantea]